MTTQSFENLDFSILIEVENNLAYLQKWDDGIWGDAERFPLPLKREHIEQSPLLSGALKSFRRDPQIDELRDALTHGSWRGVAPEPPSLLARFWSVIQAPFRELAPVEPRQP
jgi:hypothetical protein